MKNFKPQTTKIRGGSWTIFLGLCKSCGLCLEKCPTRAIIYSKEKGIYRKHAPRVISENCNLCGICETICPDCALKVDKKEK